MKNAWSGTSERAGMFTGLVRFVGIGALAFAAAACSSSSDAPATNPPMDSVHGSPVAQQDYAAALAEAVCSAVAPCCAKYGVTFHDANCRAPVASHAQQDVDDAKAANVPYDPNAAGDCVARMRALMTECVATNADTLLAIATCNAVFKGAKHAGESCSSSVECTPVTGGDVSCSVSSDAADGGSQGKVCTVSYVKTHGGAGASCAFTCTPRAEDGWSCFATGTNKKATAACYVDDGFFCDHDTSTCRAVLGDGEPCGNGICKDSDYCTGSSGVCKPRVAAGGDCSNGYYDSNVCEHGSACDQTTKVCVPKNPNGASCKTTTARRCTA